jgi:hypothetical protein
LNVAFPAIPTFRENEDNDAIWRWVTVVARDTQVVQRQEVSDADSTSELDWSGGSDCVGRGIF